MTELTTIPARNPAEAANAKWHTHGKEPNGGVRVLFLVIREFNSWPAPQGAGTYPVEQIVNRRPILLATLRNTCSEFEKEVLKNYGAIQFHRNVKNADPDTPLELAFVSTHFSDFPEDPDYEYLRKLFPGSIGVFVVRQTRRANTKTRLKKQEEQMLTCIYQTHELLHI